MATGKLNFHSETGTEGGYYTVQNSEYITYEKPSWGVFAQTNVYDPSDTMRQGKVSHSYRADGTPFTSAKPGETSLLDINWDDGETDMARNSSTVYTESWSYDGLIYINNQDRLKVFSKGIGSLILWDGIVYLEEQDPYLEGSYAPFGLACHHKPLNTDPVTADEWSKWFMESNWAYLE